MMLSPAVTFSVNSVFELYFLGIGSLNLGSGPSVGVVTETL